VAQERAHRLYLYRQTDSVNASGMLGGSYAATGSIGAGTQFMGWSDHPGYWLDLRADGLISHAIAA
jgi:hypothetical protein